MTRFGFLAIAIGAGLLNPFLGGMVSTLSKASGQPVWTTAALFASALLLVLAVALTTGQRLPDGASIAQAPWWSWFGGVMAAGYVLSTTLVAGRLGASVFTGVTVTVAIATSIVLDHYGFVGFAVHKAGLARIAGGALMAGGLGLIMRY